ncbi:hypothetical protein NM208_g14558 [Fusarium decemcellulare]|uniref:Uncharacterized protein n=1 Tax=Fusarium decemcellulare TaxID=57161 RepID=A0ACC1RHE8_9HYPO|nr:hypothetical protein NM208_g14558 [Fusarium decemcellulare]
MASPSTIVNFKAFERQPSPPRPPTSPFVSESAHVFSLQHPSTAHLSDQILNTDSTSFRMSNSHSISPMSAAETVRKPSTAPPSPLSSLGLYDKAKRSIESRLKLRTRKERCTCPPIPEYDRPYATMDRTGNYQSIRQVTKTGTWSKDETSKSNLRRKLFGKAPWVRKESAESFSSVASSVREILKGETPNSSPVTSNSSTLRVECIDNQFPRGEAVRLKTPPLAEDTTSGRPRGFFSNMVPPSEDDPIPFPSRPPLRRNSHQFVRRTSITPQTREWWEHVPKTTVHRDHFEQIAAFEFQVPEHLPSSPICPANKNHASGGTGLCVYHGRRKGTPSPRDTGVGDHNYNDSRV